MCIRDRKHIIKEAKVKYVTIEKTVSYTHLDVYKRQMKMMMTMCIPLSDM